MRELNHRIETIEEFWTEISFESIHQLRLFCILFQTCFIAKACIGSRDNNRVLEVDCISLSICQATIIQNLKKKGNHLWIRLFNFIQENDRVWIAAHALGQSVVVIIIADITSSGTNQLGNSGAVRVFRHIQTDNSLFSTKHIQS